jgi:hypothetical protein
MAQFHYDVGNKDRAEAIMRWLFDNAVADQLCDVLVSSPTAERYLPEQREQLNQGDSAAGADPTRQRLVADLNGLETAIEQRDLVPVGTPQVWAHLETLRALKRGGYLEGWQPDSTAPRLGDQDSAT